MAFYVLISDAKTVNYSSPWRYLLDDSGIQIVPKEFASLDEVNTWIEDALNEGKYLKTQIMPIDRYDYKITSQIDDTDAKSEFIDTPGDNTKASVIKLGSISTITVVGSVSTGIPQKYIDSGEFTVDMLVAEADKYSVVGLSDILPVGEVTIKQENEALKLFKDSAYPDGIKEKTYTITEDDKNYAFLISDGNDVTITITQDSDVKVYKIINKVAIS